MVPTVRVLYDEVAQGASEAMHGTASNRRAMQRAAPPDVGPGSDHGGLLGGGGGRLVLEARGRSDPQCGGG